MENIQNENILNNIVHAKSYMFELGSPCMNELAMFKLSTNLFSGMKFIHDNELSLNGGFTLKDIFYQVIFYLNESDDKKEFIFFSK